MDKEISNQKAKPLPYVVVNTDRLRKCGIVASSIEELLNKAGHKFNNCYTQIVLEENGTEIDEEYFATVSPNTCLMVLKENEDWYPAPQHSYLKNVASAFRPEEGLDLVTSSLKTVEDKDVRRLFYNKLANSDKLSDLFRNLLLATKEFFRQNYLKDSSSDILVSFVKRESIIVESPNNSTDVKDIPAPKITVMDRCIHKPIKISEQILSMNRRSSASAMLNNIGFQPIVSHKMVDTDLESTDTDSSSGSEIEAPEVKKARLDLYKTCQLKIKQACMGMLSLHRANHEQVKYRRDTHQTALKITILFPGNCKMICRDIAKHFGLIFIDNLFEDIANTARNQYLFEKTADPLSKVYSLIQNYVCRHLVVGHNNITLTCDPEIYMNVNSEVKCLIYEALDDTVIDRFKPISHMFINVQENSKLFDYIQALSYALDECFEFTISVRAVYCEKTKETKDGPVKNVYYGCLVPVVCIIPDYIVRFFCAKYMSNSERKSIFSM